MALLHALEATARRLPDKIALVEGEGRVSYASLWQRVQALADALIDDGVAPGDRVLVFLENGVQFVVAVHAVLAAGAVVVPISALAKADKVRFIATDTRASALLSEARLAAVWQEAAAAAPSLRTLRIAGAAGALEGNALLRSWPAELGPTRRHAEPPREGNDMAVLIYTSGTTGVAKGVMLSHAGLASAWSSIQAYLGLRKDDVVGLALPAAFSYGFTNLMMSLAVGATVVFDRLAPFPVKLAATLARERVTVLPGVPTLFASLLGLSDLARFDLGALRLITNAAAALPQSHARQLRAAFPGAQLISMYGMTECIRASYLPAEELDLRPGSVGRGIAGQAHWLIDDTDAPLPHGSTGEMVVSGPHLMLGYWERPEQTEARFMQLATGARALRTGDIFRSDPDGYLYFVSRRDDIIKTRGEKVAPREVENTICELDGVAACAVVGVADAALGEAVKAYVVLRPGCGLKPRNIVTYCLAHLENYMAPKWVEIVEELPRTDSGKVRHASLRGDERK